MSGKNELHARVDLSADGLYQAIREEFSKIPDHRVNPSISLTDALMSAFAIFSQKNASLLEFEREKVKNKNLQSIYKIQEIPSDTQMREIVDEVSTGAFRKIYKNLFSKLQRGKVLESYRVLDDYYILSGDGTGFFSSGKIHCKSCLVKNKKSETLYQHMMYGACIVHPDKKEVIPLIVYSGSTLPVIPVKVAT
ncbi:MAG: hypothetical protein H7A25_24440 [Leptospiraceae bacterium]|nr:hypothetical protein [Leptospiraceae bacterium]